jgi:hypothetical protein
MYLILACFVKYKPNYNGNVVLLIPWHVLLLQCFKKIITTFTIKHSIVKSFALHEIVLHM